MASGGAERLTVDLMRGMVARGHRVDLVLLQAGGEFMALVPPEVRIVNLAAPRLRSAFRPLRGYLRRERPHAVLAAMWPLTVVTLAAAIGLRPAPRVMVSDHCALLQQYAGQPGVLRAIRLTMPLAYRRAAAVVGVSQDLSAELAKLARIAPGQVTTIHNPIPPPLISGAGDPWGDARGKRVLGVGKLKAQKNFALLIRAFAQLARGMEATLAIVGVGEEEAMLRRLAGELGLADRVIFAGFSATPGDWYATADLFVLSSDYEGFGNVLVEAMHAGLPVVATDCPFGPAEVLGGGQWGALVPPGDADALATAMARALAAPPPRAVQQARAARFSVDRAVEAYARLLIG